MAVPRSYEDRLRIQFRKRLTKGHVRNAELDPTPSLELQVMLEAAETVAVRVDSRTGARYWFTDRRLLLQKNGTAELLRYSAVRRVHWMVKGALKIAEDPWGRGELKTRCYDRLEVELSHRIVVLEGLDRAYAPILSFFRWSANSLTADFPPPTPPSD